MSPEELKRRNFDKEFIYSTSRSGGPGGQNVNKVETKVELRFSLTATMLLTEIEKEKILIKLKNKINKCGELILVSQEERTQLLNKQAVTEKFYALISNILKTQKKRRTTRPTTSSKLKRLESKQSRGIIKKLRKQAGESFDL